MRTFTSYADGTPLTRIVKTLNEESVPAAIRAAKGWSPPTISRILDNEKYAGRWIWNRTESRPDAKTGRRRRFDKPESEWIVREDEDLRIVPAPAMGGGAGAPRADAPHLAGWQREAGFSGDQARRQKHFPTHLLAGSMICGCCGGTIAQVSGKSGGYLRLPRRYQESACENQTLVRRTLAERVILEAINQRISDPEQIVLQPVEAEIAKLRADLPDALKLKEAELATEQRRMVNFVDFIGEGRGSQALAKALVEAERRVESLTAEVDGLRRSRAKVFRTPPIKWITDRLNSLQEVLECRTAKSARALRTILGPIRMALITPDIGRPFYRAVTTLDALALTETPSAGAEGGSNSLQRWRRRVPKGRNSLSPSGDSVAASGRVVAGSIVCGRLLVAVSSRARRGASDRRVSSAGRRAESPAAGRSSAAKCASCRSSRHSP